MTRDTMTRVSCHRLHSTFLLESPLPILSQKCPTKCPTHVLRFENISRSDVGVLFSIYDYKLIPRRRISLICEVKMLKYLLLSMICSNVVRAYEDANLAGSIQDFRAVFNISKSHVGV